MLSILEPILFFLIVVAHHPLHTFGGTRPEDSLTSYLLVPTQKLESKIEVMEKNILKAISELQKSTLIHGRNQETNISPQYDEHFNCIGNCRAEDESCGTATLRNESKDGVYLLKGPTHDLKPFYVYCHHEIVSDTCWRVTNKNSKAWTIIQRRQDNSVNFNRTWLDYKLGFGDLNGEYWIGLERIHHITKSQPHELFIFLQEVGDFEPQFVRYLKFSVGSENEGYKLNIGDHCGTLSDGFRHFYDSVKFSTIDKDNDIAPRNCAISQGGWWMDSRDFKCTPTPLNSLTRKRWNAWHGPIFDVQEVFMAIRISENIIYGM